VSVASLAGAGTAAASPLSLPILDLTPAHGAVTTPGAAVTTPGVNLGPTVVNAIKLPNVLAKLQADVDAKLKVLVPSVALPTVSTPPVGSLIVRAPNGDILLATPPVPAITTPSGTPSVKAVIRVVAKLKAKVKLPAKTPKIVIPGLKLKPGKVVLLPVKTIKF
jgi:hypothetical protein